MTDDERQTWPPKLRTVEPPRRLGRIVVDVVERGGEIRYLAHTDPPLTSSDAAEVQRVYIALVQTMLRMGKTCSPDTDTDTDTDTDGDGR